MWLLHIDVCGPSIVESMSWKKYIMLMSTITLVSHGLLFCQKSETAQELINFIKGIELCMKLPVKSIWSDNDTKFTNYLLNNYLIDKGI